MTEQLPVGEVGAQVFLRGPGITDPALDPEPALLAAINAAKSMYAVVFSINLTSVRDALIALHQRTGDVHLVVDVTEAKGKTSVVPALVAAGLDIRAWGGNYREAHDKLAVIDKHVCITGSYNWSNLAEKTNIENMFVLTGARITSKVVPVFMQQWQQAYDQGVVLS